MKKIVCIVFCFLVASALSGDVSDFDGEWFFSTDLSSKELIFQNGDILELDEGVMYRIGHLEIDNNTIKVWIGEDLYFSEIDEPGVFAGVGITIRYTRIIVPRPNDFAIDIKRVKVPVLFSLTRTGGIE